MNHPLDMFPVLDGWLNSLRDSEFGQFAKVVIAWAFEVVSFPILVYFFMINTSYLLLILFATMDFTSAMRRAPYAGHDDAAVSPLTQPVSLVMSAYREERGIVPAVRAMLALRYPEFELVVVVDGDPDETFDVLRDAFDLVEVPCLMGDEIPVSTQPKRLYLPKDGRTPLRVVVKDNSGKADSLNVGINFARYPLVAMIDADSILDPDALLVVAKPFADDPLRVVATGGVVRAVNGCRVLGGRVVDVAMAREWLARIQVVEYFRAFMLGRAGFSRLDSLILISGAFGLFRRDVLVSVGGLNRHSIGEDFDLVMRIHREMRRRGEEYRMVFVSEATLWTEVPVTLAVLGRQRRRWQRGLWEVLTANRDMLFKPRYGRVGFAALPYYWLFEFLAPILELGGLVLMLAGLLFGFVDPWYATAFMLVAYAYGMLVSMAAVCAEEFAFHRYSRWRDLGAVLAACVLENFGYRQITAWWRVRGWWQAVTGQQQVWGNMVRAGFDDAVGTDLGAAPASVAASGAVTGANTAANPSSGTDADAATRSRSAS